MERYQSIRLFRNPILEALSHVHPIVPLLLWGPVAGWLLYRAIAVQSLSGSDILTWMLAGLVAWTLTEYSVHRFFFHLRARHRWSQYLIYLLHGVHHRDPRDPTRLVMPPVPAVLITGLLYLLFRQLIPAQYLDAFVAFFICGYLCYDYIHYATHHFPMRSRLGQLLKRHHMRHHHSGERARYGVSSPIWDFVFGTTGEPGYRQRPNERSRRKTEIGSCPTGKKPSSG